MTAVDRWTWIDVVRRTRLGRTTKGIAFLVATYADNDGSRVFPGLAVLAVAAEVDYKTAKRAVGELVKAGLLERVGRRGASRGSSTEYRLVLAEDLLERVDVLTPAAFEVEAERARAANRRGRTGNSNPRTETGVQGFATPVPDSADGPGTGNGATPAESRTGNGVPAYGERLSAVHNHNLNTTTTYPTGEEVRTALTGSRARGSEEPISTERCEHGVPPSVRCPACRRGLAAEPTGIAPVIPLRPREAS